MRKEKAMSSKQREALEAVYESAKDGMLTIRESAFEKVLEALKEPLRNCDVGTAEEQEERYIKLKREHIDKLARCPAVGWSFFPDSLYWAQLPYEKEGEA
jgi:hypothetical protein